MTAKWRWVERQWCSRRLLGTAANANRLCGSQPSPFHHPGNGLPLPGLPPPPSFCWKVALLRVFPSAVLPGWGSPLRQEVLSVGAQLLRAGVFPWLSDQGTVVILLARWSESMTLVPSKRREELRATVTLGQMGGHFHLKVGPSLVSSLHAGPGREGGTAWRSQWLPRCPARPGTRPHRHSWVPLSPVRFY